MRKYFKSKGTEIVMMTNYRYNGDEPYELIFQTEINSIWANLVFSFQEFEDRKNFVENLDQEDVDALYLKIRHDSIT